MKVVTDSVIGLINDGIYFCMVKLAKIESETRILAFEGRSHAI